MRIFLQSCCKTRTRKRHGGLWISDGFQSADLLSDSVQIPECSLHRDPPLFRLSVSTFALCLAKARLQQLYGTFALFLTRF